ncbi:hypothetical protein H9Y04_35180 [Streptomyces sp. TRM66268-LWL]|uniref:Ribosome maturation factor RimM n=1 Tax=Streptomyces polyasparticus TaxID=2767826 RepID=A0ABR7SQK8_9ACTN|nr:hypothetical protein [Streptomyces polyasparticus]MBC9717787.1 hypothetical protein [Streptomyces polyasparticus]
MTTTIERTAAPVVPAQHAQALATTTLRTWPKAIGLSIEYVTHHERGPQGSVTYAVVRTMAPDPGEYLIRCDGYGRVARACEHRWRDGTVCWDPSASHLSVRDPGLCDRHVPPLAPGTWVRHPDQPAYGRVTEVGQEGSTVTADFGRGPVTLLAVRVPRVPPHIAAELDHGPLSNAIEVLDD